MKNKQSSLPKKEVESVFALYSSGEFQKAVEVIKSLNSLYPNQPLLFNLIGACYKELGELAGAAKMFEIAITLSPQYAEAHFNLGVIHQDLDQKELAVKCYKKAIEITPNYPSAHNNLGNVYKDLDELDSSIESLEWAIAYKHDYAEAHNNLGNSLYESGRVQDAVKSFEKALFYNPTYARAMFNLSLALKDIGKKEDYHKLIEKTVQLKPHWSDAQLHLSRVKKYKNNDPQIAQLHSFLNQSNLTLKDSINFNFTLAKVYEDIGDHENQFEFLNEANRLRKEESGYKFEKDLRLFSNIKETFKNPPKPLTKSIIKSSEKSPIFILGMPRSGTSLVHQIVSNHKQVYGAGELTKLNKFVTPYLKDSENKEITKQDLLSIRENYTKELSSLNVTENIIVDKMPLNFRYIGFILSAFPDSKIIHMNRDSMAVCWSIYKYFFPGNTYSYNQKDIAAYYCLYEDLMDFWKKKFPNKIYDLYYEELTINQKFETMELLKYCDLEWDENCLNFHKNTTAVKTTSAIQVKNKMYQGSSDAWKKYEAYLKPLLDGLSYYKDQK
jgi:tetratricopeptide (TPR) repeat protein